MSTRPNRPPRNIDAARYFGEWLPQQFTVEFGVGRRKASDITVAVHLEGPGGGNWILDVQAGILRLRPADAEGPEPLVTLVQPFDDWHAVAVGEEGGIELAPPKTSPLDVLFVDPTSRQIMSAVRGTVRFEITGFHGRTWWMQVKFGTQPMADPVDATISIDALTYASILERRLPPPEAYFSGKIHLSGDTGLAMQLGMAILPRFG